MFYVAIKLPALTWYRGEQGSCFLLFTDTAQIWQCTGTKPTRLHLTWKIYVNIYMYTYMLKLFPTGSKTGVQFLAGAMMELLIFAIASRPALRPIQPLIQWEPGGSSYFGVKLPGH